ncbi:MAG: TonB-dependent receptor plug domain-containing protein [Candidatus Cryptobacteroides sp.]
MERRVLSLLMSLCLMGGFTLSAQEPEKVDSLDAAVSQASSSRRSLSRIESVEIIGKAQLVRAACCNLGESFTTNPSVDVSYSDASTGARQIKLLGLSGTYVQMLTENMPNLRGASLPYSLSYVPGPWMQSIQVSKGASSVKNGFESITGQINIEYLKPQANDGIHANAYLDSELKQEYNLEGNVHLTDKFSIGTLLHYENRQMGSDGNADGFMDMPKLRQWDVMQRLAYVSPQWISQLSLKALRDEREGGQMGPDPYTTLVETERYEAQWKNGFTLDPEHNTSIALMLNASLHDAQNVFGRREYDVIQKTLYAQLMYETDITESHNLSLGLSLNHDAYDESFSEQIPLFSIEKETTAGIYAQYTYKLGEKLILMPGLRWDYSSYYGAFLTPRLHVKYSPSQSLSIRASAGKGYRSVHPLAENVSLLASVRSIVMEEELRQEEAWNMGLSASWNVELLGKMLNLNAEYYYTDFLNQMVLNVDGRKGEHTLSFENLDGKSYSHTFQLDASYPFFKGLTADLAFRLNDVKCSYDGVLRQKYLTSRYKGLLSLSYKTPLELWQFDITGQLNGGGVLYDLSEYPAYFLLQAQITREFQYFSIYLGGENLTNYKMPNPVLNAQDPWSAGFDATQIWGPVTGAMIYIGVRINFDKI